jgi:4a-hydroxytetrahydrobiopterin dehydratase
VADLLNPDALHTSLNQLPDWDGTTERLHKEFAFADEAGAATFTRRVSDLADTMDHHPELETRGTTVVVEIRSHEAGGVTEQCVELARRIEGLQNNLD